MTTHNPKQAIEQLQVILCNPSKKIGFLFGAGTSMQDGDRKSLIPNINELTNKVVEQFKKDPQKTAIQTMKKEIGDAAFNIESLLSKISEKAIAATATEKLCGMNKVELIKLRKDIEKNIETIVAVHTTANFEKRNLSHYDFARWIKNADRESAIEIFTTNYDYLIELALEKYQIPYFDGFIGSYNAFFCPEWIEGDYAVRKWTRLWKLHGSLGWAIKDNNIIRTSKGDASAMIYPSFLKYSHSRKQPYLSYMDRLSHFLRQEDSVLFVCGHSFGDEHINETILTALSRSRSSNVFILKNGELKEDDALVKELAKENSKITVYAKRTAVIGCNFGEWKLDSEPTRNESYNILDYGFDEDAATKEEEPWTGRGNFLLGDFLKFTKFLSLFYHNSKFIKKEQ